MKKDSDSYLARKKQFDQMLTIYGRKPALEALKDGNVDIYKLHLSESNKPAPIIDELIRSAQSRGAEVVYHDKKALSRISKNAKQDQGVAVDIKPRSFQEYEHFLSHSVELNFKLIALDRITNPQNLGMIIRSICASPLHGLILPRRGCAKLDSLVIKATTGTLFRAPIIRCDELEPCLEDFKAAGSDIVGLEVNASTSLANYQPTRSVVYVLGNETEGLSPSVQNTCNQHVQIPMANQVESLNVAITASLLAFRELL